MFAFIVIVILLILANMNEDFKAKFGPYIVAILFIYTIIMCIYKLRKKRKEKNKEKD